MKYVNAIIKESLRRYPLYPLSTTSNPTQFGGYIIPKKSITDNIKID